MTSIEGSRHLSGSRHSNPKPNSRIQLCAQTKYTDQYTTSDSNLRKFYRSAATARASSPLRVSLQNQTPILQ